MSTEPDIEIIPVPPELQRQADELMDQIASLPPMTQTPQPDITVKASKEYMLGSIDGKVSREIAELLWDRIEKEQREYAELATRARNVVALLKKRLHTHDGYNLRIADDFLDSLRP